MKTLSVVLLACVLGGCAGSGFPVKDSKHAVCHKGKTIYVDEAAVAAHVRHGDYGRACYGERKEGAGESK